MMVYFRRPRDDYRTTDCIVRCVWFEGMNAMRAIRVHADDVTCCSDWLRVTAVSQLDGGAGCLWVW